MLALLVDDPFSSGFGNSEARRYVDAMEKTQRSSQRSMERIAAANNALLGSNDDYGQQMLTLESPSGRGALFGAFCAGP